MTTKMKEQWEALILETRFWRRPRETKMSKFTVFDSIDEETILEAHISDFRDKGGFRTPLDGLRSLDHPLARFYRLFYTEEFIEFRSRTLSELGGAASLARGVAELLIDQIFRYFLFVEADELNARRFGQLVVGISVFRNTFDATSMDFLKTSLRQTNRRIFNSAVVPGSIRGNVVELEEGEEEEDDGITEVFQEGDLMLEYPRVITQMLRGNRLEQDFVDEMLNISAFGVLPMKNVSFNFPLSTNLSLFNPHRRIILHILHLVSVYGAAEEQFELIYVGDIEEFVRRAIGDILPRNVRFISLPSRSSKTEILASRVSGKSFILVLDQGGEDDSTLFQQIGLLRTLPSERVKAVSLTFRIPTSLSIENDSFKFCKGVVFQTAWKNPKDGNMRLVWEPTDELDVSYNVRRLYNARCFQDYVVRPLYRFKNVELTSADEAFGMISGEFDSELEKTIIQEFYNRYPSGNKTWVEVVDSEEHMDEFTVLSSIRFIAFEKKLSLEALMNFQDEIVAFHLSNPSNVLFNDAVKIRRGGLFPTLYHPSSPVVDAIERVFGGRDDQKSLAIYDTYQKILQTRTDYIREMELRNIFPRERSKDNLLPVLKSLAPKTFGDLIMNEPSEEMLSSSLRIEQMFRTEDRPRDFVFVQFGDTLGNILELILYSMRNSGYTGSKTLYANGTFDPKPIWNLVSSEKMDIRFITESQLQYLQDQFPSQSPILIVEGYVSDSLARTKETMEVAKRELAKLSGIRGTVRQTPEGWVFLPPPEKDVSVYTRALKKDVIAENCLVIGGEYEDVSLALVGNRAMQRIHIIAETESGGKICETKLEKFRYPRRITQKVFVQEDLTRTFIPPIRGQKYDFILCSPYVLSRFFETDESAKNFLSCIEEELLSENGRLHSLIIRKEKIFEAHARAQTSDDRLLASSGEFSFPAGKETSEIQTYKYGSRQYFVSDFDVERYVRKLIVQVEEGYNQDTYPFSFFSLLRGRDEAESKQPFKAYQGVAVDVGRRVRETNNYVKRVLIEKVADKTSVLDLACGHGQDFGKWFVPENSVRVYVGLDASEKAIKEARKRFKSFDVRPSFFKLDVQNLFGNSAWTIESSDYVRGKGFSAVSCQLSIHYGFSEEETVRTFVTDVGQIMKMNGEFIVSTLDYEDIRRKTLKVLSSQVDDSEVVLSGEHYRIKMETETARAIAKGEVIGAGTAYRFHQFPSDEMSRETVEYVVDGRYFERIAKKAGLEMILSQNFLEFSSSNPELSKMVADLDESERDVVGLYRVYKFRKTADIRDIQKVAIPEVIPEFKIRKFETQKILMKELAINTPKFSRGLLFQPENLNIAPYFPNHDYESLHMVTETVFQIPMIFQGLKNEKVLNDRQRVFVQTDALEFIPPANKPYDHFFFAPITSSRLTETSLRRYSALMSEQGMIEGCYIDKNSVIKLFPNPLEDSFANSLFTIRLPYSNRYILDDLDPELSTPFLDIETLKTICLKIGLRVTEDIAVRIPSGLKEDQRAYLSIFRRFIIQRNTGKPPVQREEVKPVEEEKEAEIESVGLVDRFVLAPKMLKKPAGTAAGESLRQENKKKYQALNKDHLWRAKLSDSYDGGEPVRMETGEIFKTVSSGLLYFRGQFASLEGYEALNLNSGLPYPENTKAFSKAITGKRGKEWKENEGKILEKLYSAKFTNVGSQDDDPTNLSPLKALLLTRDAELYVDSKTRNELLEEIRARIRVIYGNI